MSSELSSKLQIAIWWITSIAISVLCCSILFVLFASYLVDMKEAVKDSDARITAIEEREDKILTELEFIYKHSTIQPQVPTSLQPMTQLPDSPTSSNGVEMPVEKNSAPAEIPSAPPVIPSTATPAPTPIK